MGKIARLETTKKYRQTVKKTPMIFLSIYNPKDQTLRQICKKDEQMLGINKIFAVLFPKIFICHSK